MGEQGQQQQQLTQPQTHTHTHRNPKNLDFGPPGTPRGGPRGMSRMTQTQPNRQIHIWTHQDTKKASFLYVWDFFGRKIETSGLGLKKSTFGVKTKVVDLENGAESTNR